MKRRIHVLGVIAALVASGAFIAYVASALRGHDLSVYGTPRAVAGIILAALVYGAGVPLLALAWREMLLGLGVPKHRRELVAIIGTTQIAKYVPGNIGQYLGRAAMSLAHDIPPPALAVTLVLETLLVVAAAVIVGVGTAMFSTVGLELVHSNAWQISVILIMITAVAAGLLMFRDFAPRLLRRFAPRHASLLSSQILPPRNRIVRAFVLYCVANLCVGFGLVLLTYWLLPDAKHATAFMVGCSALAWVVGFATPGAPAGLGVREGLLLLMLGPVFTPALAGVLIIALRLATTLGDVLWFFAGLMLLPKRLPAPTP
jgi:hypothetical protein